MRFIYKFISSIKTLLELNQTKNTTFTISKQQIKHLSLFIEKAKEKKAIIELEKERKERKTGQAGCGYKAGEKVTEETSSFYLCLMFLHISRSFNSSKCGYEDR